MALTALGVPAERSYAQEISVEAFVDRTTVELGASLQLTLTINGTQSVNPVDLPDIDGLQSQFLGPSTRISIVNGQYSSSKNFIYALYPLKTGKFRIPAFKITIDSQVYTTQPIDIEVVDEGAVPAPTQTDNLQESKDLFDKIFIVMGTPNIEAYINEKIPITIKLFINGLAARDIQYPEFEHVGFSAGDFEQPTQYQQTIGGIQYSVVEFKTYVYPTRTGSLTLGPAKLTCNLLFKKQERGSIFGGFGTAFDDDLFDGFFQSYQRRSVTLESTDLKINILPLPEEGKPEDFSGAVGLFDLEATLSPDSVKVGDPLTLKLRAWGTGNMKALEMPQIKTQDGLKLYEPQIKEENGIKTLEQVLIPGSENITEIPAVDFSFFNPQTRKYETLSKGPFPIKVMKPAPGEEFKVVGLDDHGQQGRLNEELGRGIVFIKENPGKFYRAGSHLYGRLKFRILAVFAVLLWLGLFLYYRRTLRLQTDSVYARKLFAPQKAKKGILRAGHLLSVDRQKEFYDCIFKVLQEYLADLLHVPPAGLTFTAVQNSMSSKIKEGQIFEKIKKVFDESDMVRFASFSSDLEEMKTSLRNVQEIIDYLERHWR